MRNPNFFPAFTIDNTLDRSSTTLYHYPKPLWYSLPVTALALLPWTFFVIVAFVQRVRMPWASLKSAGAGMLHLQNQFGMFACCWLILPLLFFSFSQSKLPGYILPAIPAGGLLLTEYLRQRLTPGCAESGAKALVVPHALVASAPIVPALLIAYLVTQHRLPGGRAMLVALAIAFALCAGIALTLVRASGLRMLRFVTLIPAVLAVGAALKLSSAAIDQTLSARPLAHEIANIETHPMPLAVYHVRREVEYGLSFYRNQLTNNYDWGKIPPQANLIVGTENSQTVDAQTWHVR